MLNISVLSYVRCQGQQCKRPFVMSDACIFAVRNRGVSSIFYAIRPYGFLILVIVIQIRYYGNAAIDLRSPFKVDATSVIEGCVMQVSIVMVSALCSNRYASEVIGIEFILFIHGHSPLCVVG